MSGGGGGVIIIRRNKLKAALKAIALDADVRAAVPAQKLMRYDAICSMSHEDWDEDQFHFVRRCLGDAFDNVS